MSYLGLMSLILALVSAVVGADASPTWAWGNGTFFMFLVLAIVAFAASTLQRPSLLWEVIDDFNGRRLKNPRCNERSRTR